LHFTCTHQGRVNSWLLVVRSQTASLTFDPSFCHNLCYKCPNGSCEAIFNIDTSIAFQWNEERFKARCFDLWNRTLKFWESQRTPKSPFLKVWVSSSHSSKSGVTTKWVHTYIDKFFFFPIFCCVFLSHSIFSTLDVLHVQCFLNYFLCLECFYFLSNFVLLHNALELPGSFKELLLFQSYDLKHI